MLKGAVIVFVTAGYSGKRFIFERAKELGVRSVVLDGPDSWVQALAADGTVDRFVPLDFADADTVFERALDAVLKVKREVGEVDGVCTFCEMAVPLVARLAEKLGLPGNPPSAVDDARDKSSTRAVMEAAGLPSPRSFLITEEGQLGAAAAKVGFPAVIKPIFGAASIGVVRVNSEAELEATYRRVQKEMGAARIVAGALQQGPADDDGGGPDDRPAASTWIKTTLMLEEYLDGPEVDVDLVLSEGAPVYGAITDNWPTVEPYFNETGSNCPSILPAHQQRELIDLGVRSVHALGFTMGVFHVELKYTSHGPRLIEVNCRMGGGPVRNTNLLVWGVDLVEEHLLTAAGVPSRPPVAPRPLKFIAEFSINAKKTGRITDVDFMKAGGREGGGSEGEDRLVAREGQGVGGQGKGVGPGRRAATSAGPCLPGRPASRGGHATAALTLLHSPCTPTWPTPTGFLQEWEDDPDVLYARPLVAVGEKVTCVEDGMPTWVAELMVTKPTVEEAIEFVQTIEQSTEVPIA